MSIDAKLDRMDAKLDRLLKANKPRQTWVNATWLKNLTGWTGEQMREAREMDIVEYRKKKSGSYLYLLQSLDEKLIVKK